MLLRGPSREQEIDLPPLHRFANRLLLAGLVLAAAAATASTLRAALASPPELAARATAAGAALTLLAIAAVQARGVLASWLQRGLGGWLQLWSLLVVTAFFLDGPGDELLLPAGLGPVILAGLVGAPTGATNRGRRRWMAPGVLEAFRGTRLATRCAAIVCGGYLAELVLVGSGSQPAPSLHLVLTNIAFVVMTGVVVALPVWKTRESGERAAERVAGWQADPYTAPRVLRVGRYREMLDAQRQEILAMLRAGRSAEEIGSALFLGERTARRRIAQVKRTMNARTLDQLVALAATEDLDG